MSVSGRIRRAILPLVPVCVPDLYRPKPGQPPETEYCTFQYDEFPDLFADDAPGMIQYLIQLHWFLPAGRDPVAKKKQLRRALAEAGFTYPEVVNASGEDGQHYVFECRCTEGAEEDG